MKNSCHWVEVHQLDHTPFKLQIKITRAGIINNSAHENNVSLNSCDSLILLVRSFLSIILASTAFENFSASSSLAKFRPTMNFWNRQNQHFITMTLQWLFHNSIGQGHYVIVHLCMRHVTVALTNITSKLPLTLIHIKEQINFHLWGLKL